MRNQKPVVHCVFAEGETNLEELVEESFRLYLRSALARELELPCDTWMTFSKNSHVSSEQGCCALAVKGDG